MTSCSLKSSRLTRLAATVVAIFLIPLFVPASALGQADQNKADVVRVQKLVKPDKTGPQNTGEANSTSSARSVAASSGTAGDTVFGGANLDEEMVVGKVLSVTVPKINKELLQHTGMVTQHQTVRVRVQEGPLNGKEFVIPHELTDNPAFNISVKPDQEVVLAVVPGQDGQLDISIADYHRAPVLFGLLGVFLVAFLLFGGKKGVKSLIGLLATVLLIGCILLPLSLKGYNPLITAVGICLLATATSILLIGGLSKKSLSAIIGTVGGVIIAGVSAQLVIDYAPLTGLSSEEAQILRGSVLVQELPFYCGLLAAGMLIGALGVIMDVGISIASSVAEVAKADPNATTKQLYEAGMNVGRDIMGTMTNTLILAYAGSALPLLLLATQMPSIKLLNLDLFATEVASALSGSLGLTFTIPLTALAAAKLMSDKKV
ncbi:MAG: YibE/F family protein [Candidatus Obscuribacterales bacterium]|nr:YibE/F family protein [Candidatus Obscuribacterales bacterium]